MNELLSKWKTTIYKGLWQSNKKNYRTLEHNAKIKCIIHVKEIILQLIFICLNNLNTNLLLCHIFIIVGVFILFFIEM